MTCARALFCLVATVFLYACKIEIIVPEGARVVSESGAYACESGQTCTIEVLDVFFDERFIAIAPDGQKFTAWLEKDNYICGGFRAPCPVQTTFYPGTPLEEHLASDITFQLQPVFGVANSWSRKADTLVASVGASNCVVRGKLYAIGLGWFTNQGKVEEYNPETGQWTSRSDMPTPRTWLSTTAVGPICYAIGGANTGGPHRPPALTAVEAYDPRQDSWQARTPLPEPRNGAASAAVGSKIYVVGGAEVAWFESTANADVVIYDTKSDSWSRGADMPTPRGGLAAVALDGMIYAMGGAHNGDASNALERYDPKKDEWTVLAPMPGKRHFPTAAVVDGKIYVLGGLFDRGNNTQRTVMRYDPQSNQWNTVAPLSVERYGATAATLNGKLLIVGGRQFRESPPLHLVEEYTP